MDYLIRDVDSSLWADFKACSEAEGLPMRTLLLALVRFYVELSAEERASVTGDTL